MNPQGVECAVPLPLNVLGIDSDNLFLASLFLEERRGVLLGATACHGTSSEFFWALKLETTPDWEPGLDRLHFTSQQDVLRRREAQFV